MLIMKEKQKSLEEKLRALEEGLQEKVPESKKKFEHKTSVCIRVWIRSLYLILLLELMLFLAGSCYIIFQKYSFQVPENKDIALEKYISILDSMSEAQKSHPTTEMPEKLIKSDIIVDQLNNFLEDMRLIKKQELTQNKISATDADSTMIKSTQNSINIESDNAIQADFSSWPRIRLSLGDFRLNKEFSKDSTPWEFSSSKYIDRTDKNTLMALAKLVQFFERLQDVAEIKSKIETDSKDFKIMNDFTHDANRLTSNSQENYESDASNKLESLKLSVTTISNPEDSMDYKLSASLINNLENWKQKLTDEIKEVSSELESGYVICPPDQSDESFDTSQKSSAKGFSIFQSVSTQENLKQTKSNENINARSEDKPNVDDSNLSMSTSDAPTSESNDSFLFNVLLSRMENTRIQDSPEIAANIKVDEKQDSTENINDLSEIWGWQDSVKRLTSNDDKFQWSNAPARFADDLQSGPVDISKLNDAKIDQFLSANPESIEDFNFGSQCQVQIVIGILMVKCPAISFDEEWNLASVETHTSDFPDVNNYENFYYDFYDAANDQLREELTSQHNVPEITSTVELQENTPSVNILNASPERIKLDFVHDPKATQDDPVDNLNEKEIRQTITTVSPSNYEYGSDYVDSLLIDSDEKFISWLKTLNSKQQESEEHLPDYKHNVPDYDLKTSSSEISDLTASALEKKLALIFNNETKSLIDYIESTKPSSFGDNYTDYAIHNIPSYILTSSSPDSWHQQYNAAKKVVEDIRNREFPFPLWDSNNDRKKRMAITEWQSVENTIEESNKNVEVLQHMKKLFQRMKILAVYIDKLHEQYLLHNKLDDDYVSSEFPIEIRK